MADIELVIKIPEEQYNLIRLSDKTAMANWVSREAMMCAIKNGAPLPKGHGRLIDADETLKKHCVDLCREKPSCYEDCLIYDLFHLTPTIIEADRRR